jgi:molecular chaperone DnaJ
MHPAAARAILGVPDDADEASVRAAWRRLAKRWHPDLNPDDPDARTRFEAARAAYQDFVRSRAATQAFRAASPFRRADVTAAARAASAPVDLALPVRDFIAGADTFVPAPMGGVARVRVPAGSRPGDELVARTPAGGAVRVRLQPDASDGWRIDGVHIRGVAVLPAGRLASWALETPHGVLRVKLPAEAEPGAVLRLKGRGLPARELSLAGDLLVELKAAPAAVSWLARARGLFRRAAA